MLRTKKSLGQHFLRSERALADIAGAIPLTPKDTVLEIGPGEGVLTKKLLGAGACVIAVEKDDRLIPVLQKQFENEIEKGQLILLHGDAVEATVQKKLFALLPVGWVLVANIPYYITGLILRTFLDGKNKPRAMVLLVQREVAEDILARDGKESIGSIAVKVYGTPSIVARVPRGAFVPPPAVDSAILKIENIRESFQNEKERTQFFHILRTGFKSKRKTILNTLSATEMWSKKGVGEMLRALHIPPSTRPERLSVEDWKRVSSFLK